MPNENEATAIQPAKKKRSVLGCLLSLVAGFVLLVVLLSVFVVWLAGSNIVLKQAGAYVNQKSGGNLTFAENDTNFFAGRLHWKGVELTNPSRFTDKGFVKIDELKGEVAIGSVIRTGLGLTDTIEVPEVVVNIGSLSLVGSDDWTKDNNAMDFKKAFVPETAAQPAEQPKTEQPKTEQPTPAQTETAAPKKHFRIGKLTVKFDKIRVLSHATTPGEKPNVIVDDSANINIVLTDVTDENIVKKLTPELRSQLIGLGGKFAQVGVALGTAFINDQIKSITDKAGETVKNVTGQAGKAVDDAAKSVTGALDGLLGGSKKKDEPTK